jgi:hypothetical protein
LTWLLLLASQVYFELLLTRFTVHMRFASRSVPKLSTELRQQLLLCFRGATIPPALLAAFVLDRSLQTAMLQFFVLDIELIQSVNADSDMMALLQDQVFSASSNGAAGLSAAKFLGKLLSLLFNDPMVVRSTAVLDLLLAFLTRHANLVTLLLSYAVLPNPADATDKTMSNARDFFNAFLHQVQKPPALENALVQAFMSRVSGLEKEDPSTIQKLAAWLLTFVQSTESEHESDRSRMTSYDFAPLTPCVVSLTTVLLHLTSLHEMASLSTICGSVLPWPSRSLVMQTQATCVP